MPTDFNGREPDIAPTTPEDTMFGATPVWDRARKRKSRFGIARKTETPPDAETRAPEPRSFAPEPAAAPAMTLGASDVIVDDPVTTTPSTFAATPRAPIDEPMAAPIGRPTRTTHSRSSGVSPAMIAGGVAAVALLGVGGWYLASPHDGVPELAPGEPSTSVLAATPVLPPEQPAEVNRATNTLSERPAAAPVRTARAAPPPAARVRPAATSAAASGTNASAVLPDGPQPYSTANPPAPAQVTPPPVEAAPPPVEAAPPTQAPSETPPPTDPVTPPQA